MADVSHFLIPSVFLYKAEGTRQDYPELSLWPAFPTIIRTTLCLTMAQISKLQPRSFDCATLALRSDYPLFHSLTAQRYLPFTSPYYTPHYDTNRPLREQPPGHINPPHSEEASKTGPSIPALPPSIRTQHSTPPYRPLRVQSRQFPALQEASDSAALLLFPIFPLWSPTGQ